MGSTGGIKNEYNPLISGNETSMTHFPIKSCGESVPSNPNLNTDGIWPVATLMIVMTLFPQILLCDGDFQFRRALMCKYINIYPYYDLGCGFLYFLFLLLH